MLMEIALLIAYIVFGALYCSLMFVDIRQNARLKFVIGAAFGAVFAASSGSLALLAWRWLEQGGPGLMLLIGFVCVLFYLFSVIIGGVLRLLYRD